MFPRPWYFVRSYYIRFPSSTNVEHYKSKLIRCVILFAFCSTVKKQFILWFAFRLIGDKYKVTMNNMGNTWKSVSIEFRGEN